MRKVSKCGECGAQLGPHDQTCQSCGAPHPYGVNEAHVGCAVCGADISSYTETCPECGERGYPALRPRRGRKFKGSPELEDNRNGS